MNFFKKQYHKGDITVNLIFLVFFLTVTYISFEVFGVDQNLSVQSIERAFNGSMNTVENFINHIRETYFN